MVASVHLIISRTSFCVDSIKWKSTNSKFVASISSDFQESETLIVLKISDNLKLNNHNFDSFQAGPNKILNAAARCTLTFTTFKLFRPNFS